MSATTTSLVPTPLSSSYHNALQTTQRTASQASQALTKASSRVSQQVQSIGSTTPKSPPISAPASTPGKFRHPLTTEILKRNAASSITERHVKGAVTNAAALLLSFVFSDVYYNSVNTLLSKTGILDVSQISSTVLLLVRLLFCTNMIIFLRPALPYAPVQDEINDIPLTPSQRQLLGLPPSEKPTPASAGSPTGFVTPPRYRRVSNSQFSAGSNDDSQRSDRRSISANYSASPLGFSPTASQSAVTRRAASGSPFSPSPTASPLFHKAISNQNQAQISDLDFNASTFSSFGNRTSTSTGYGVSSLSRSQSMRERHRPRRESLEPGSPSPVRGQQIVPGLNYKWLYDKGRKLPKSESSYGF